MIRVAAVCAAVVGALQSTPVRAADLTIGDYVLVSKKDVGQGRSDYVLRAAITNHEGDTLHHVRAAATSRVRSIEIIDGALSFGTVAGHRRVTSQDTFTVRAWSMDWPRLRHLLRHAFSARDLWLLDRNDDARSFRHDRRDHCDDDDDDHRWRRGRHQRRHSQWHRRFKVLVWTIGHGAAPDTAAPTVSGQAPKGVTVASSSATIRADYQDAGSGVDVDEVALTLDGADVTDAAAITATGVSYDATALADGAHTVLLAVADDAGNETTSEWTFVVDTGAPGITDLAPTAGATVAADALLRLSGVFTDAGSGVDISRVRVELDGQDVTTAAGVTAGGFGWTLTAPLFEGAHVLRVTAVDGAGNVAQGEAAFTTSTPPTISGQTPKDVFLAADAQPVITATLADVGAGIDVDATRLFFNGADVTATAKRTETGASYTVPQPLSDGTHTVRVVATDRAGNSTQSEWRFGTSQPPEILAYGPKDVILPPGSQPAITASFRDVRVGIDAAATLVLLNGEDVSSRATITQEGFTYTPESPLAIGPYTVYLELANRTNALSAISWGFMVDAPRVYTVSMVSPSPGATVYTPRVQIEATAQATGVLPERMTLNGGRMMVVDVSGEVVTYRGGAHLLEGSNPLTFQADFSDGTSHTTNASLVYAAPPRVVITAPQDKATLGRANTTSPGDLTGVVERPVTVAGRVDRPVTSVRINQQEAQLLGGGTEFLFENFFLREGLNLITAVATDAGGQSGSAAVTVSVDQTAPILSVEAPVGGAITSGQAIDVRGVVNDAVEGMFDSPEPTVTVNGRPAQVSDRYFLAADVPLEIGDNVLSVTATDQLGNTRTRVIRVTRTAVGSDRLTIVSGTHQAGAAVTLAPKPLAVMAIDSTGAPLADLSIRFDVVRGTGTISRVSDPSTPTFVRSLEVATDAQGRAQVWLTLGKQAGPGTNVVTAGHPDLPEGVTFVATTERGAVSKVSADTGIYQFAEVRSQPLELLSVVVRDIGDNVLPNVPVVFEIETGDGFFPDDSGQPQARAVARTDKNGVAAIRPHIGTLPGLVLIRAQAIRDAGGSVDDPAQRVGNANYYIQAKLPGNGPATFKGQVFTDKGAPLPGVRISVGRTAVTSTTDASGSFELSDVPPGRIDLFVDGRTTTHEDKTWPSLHFETFAVRGQVNQLPHPIYLPPLLMAESKVVGGNEDVILRMPGVEGFQMKVKANSVTFPDGSRIGTLVVSPVTADRLPMAPPAGGAAFGVPAWTIQPAGARFDPPIEVRLPNSSSQPPGDNLPVVQWDHDLGQFVPMGRATVTEDGAFLVTDAGSGVTKAGWGGLCVYDPPKTAQDQPSQDDPPDCPPPPECGPCFTSGGRGRCKGCVYDGSRHKDRVDGEPEVTVDLDYAQKLTDEVLDWLLTKLKTKRFSLEGSVGGTYTTKRLYCCSPGANMADLRENHELDVRANLEVALSYSPAFLLEAALDLIRRRNAVVPDLVPDLHLIVGAAGGVRHEWQACEEKYEGDGLITVQGDLAFGTDPHPAPDPGGQPATGTVFEAFVGASIGADFNIDGADKNFIWGRWSAEWALYAKLGLRFRSFIETSVEARSTHQLADRPFEW